MTATALKQLPHTGIDQLLKDHEKITSLKGKKVGLLTNQSSLTSTFVPTVTALQSLLGSSLSYLFVPEHGWSAFCPAGEDIENSREPSTNLPIFSLYGPLFEKNMERLQTLDTLIIDLQDVGVRCYTYTATCAKVLEHTSLNTFPTEVVVCDRPNPLGPQIRDLFGKASHRSLVNYTDVPFQHGKTMGQLLERHNRMLHPPVLLSVIPSSSQFDPHSHFWVPPSPGLPDWEAVFLYPGLVLLEGTNVSEGRGSSLPFKCVAAPGLDPIKITNLLNSLPDSGIRARPFQFMPQKGKHESQLCQGVQIHVTNFQKVDGLKIGLHLLHGLARHYPIFEWVQSKNGYWIDQLTGSSDLREAVDSGKGHSALFATLG